MSKSTGHRLSGPPCTTTNGDGHEFNADGFIRRPSFLVSVKALGDHPRRYDVDIRRTDGTPWKAITAEVVYDPFGPQLIKVDGWEMYVCCCKAGAVASDHRHTCGRDWSHAEWIATAVDRYLAVHPEKFIPELQSPPPSGRPS